MKPIGLCGGKGAPVPMSSADETELYCIEGVNIDVLLPTFYVPSEEEGDIDSKSLFEKSESR